MKYHPDKVGPANTEALEKFHLLQIAYDVLSDPTVRELYDNARRARQQKAQQRAAFEGRRKAMVEDLERRESGFKRKREDGDAEDVFERELRRIAADGKRRREAREEEMRREMLEEQERGRDGGVLAQNGNGDVEKAETSDIDRSISFRFPQSAATKDIDQSEITKRFDRFGPIEDVVLRDKKIKPEGSKHRQPHTTVLLVYKSIVGAHAAVSDFPKLAKQDAETFAVFESVTWAGGKEPDCIPKPVTAATAKASREASPAINGQRTVPSFSSFKGTAAKNGASLDEITMIRLKNAEKKRLEEKIRREEAMEAGD